MTWALLRRCVMTALIAVALGLIFNLLLKMLLGKPTDFNEAFWIETAPVMFLVGFFIPLAPKQSGIR